MRHDQPKIIRARAPLRLGLAGGGTDLSPFCDNFGGAVLNCTIAKYANATLAPIAGDQVRIVSRDLDASIDIPCADYAERAAEDRRFALATETLRRIAADFFDGVVPALRIETAIDSPMGSGLGSSSALVVALIEAFTLAFDLPLGQYEIAKLAWEIERQDLGLAGGKQDQYAAAFGGLNFIEFLEENRVVVNPLRLPASTRFELEASLVIAYTGISRRSEDIIKDQVKLAAVSGSAALDSLHSLKQDAYDLKAALLGWSVDRISETLNKSWEAKKRTSSLMTTPEINAMYTASLAAGALGGKISGAGGGGFFVFFVDPDRREAVRRVLETHGAKAEFVSLCEDGARAWQAPAPRHWSPS